MKEQQNKDGRPPALSVLDGIAASWCASNPNPLSLSGRSACIRAQLDVVVEHDGLLPDLSRHVVKDRRGRCRLERWRRECFVVVPGRRGEGMAWSAEVRDREEIFWFQDELRRIPGGALAGLCVEESWARGLVDRDREGVVVPKGKADERTR
jgi:hypothetical protein